MKIKFTLLSLLFFTSSVFGQFGFERIDTITVIDGTPQAMPWAGGIDYPQLSNIDLNWDGIEDLFVFDRSCNKVLTFLHTGGIGDVTYTYAPEYEALFPEMRDWALLVDYNCDGKKDIYTYTIGGGKVFKNVGNAGSGHAFELVKANLKTWLWGSEGYMYISAIDMPAIVDVDGDSDIDIISFGVGSQALEYHKNLSMETYGNCDSLIYETKNLCWGRFKEDASTNSVTLYDTTSYPCDGTISNPESWRPGQQGEDRHAGSTILALDMNNSGVMDLVIGDISYPNMTLLMNGGTAPNTNSAMISQDPNFPSNSVPVNVDIHPAGFHVDVNNDGVRDFIAAPSSKIGSENREGVLYYENTGADLNPTFEFVQRDFLQGEMIENGSGALPVFFDHNADGLKDLLVSVHGQYDTVTNFVVSKIAYYENTGTAQQPQFTFVTGDYQNISTLGLGNSRVFYPTFGDLDNDGDEDMIMGEYLGYMYYMENTAGAGNPAIFNTYSLLEDDNMDPIRETNNAYPQLVDLDRDGDLDLILGKRSGKISWYENIGNSSIPVFSLVTTELGEVDVSEWWTVEGQSIPQFIDIDNEYHLILGSKSGYLHYYDNIDGNLGGTWNLVDSTLEDIHIGTFSAPAFYDLNGDNRLEMVLGNQRGGVALYKSAPLTDVGINVSSVGELKIYPNPATSSFFIDLGTVNFNSLSQTTIELRDLSGRLIHTSQPQQSLIEMSTAGLSKGTYIVRVVSGAEVRVQKILLQ
ncbi:MAG: T9SS type A sorting domain-containing protein [Crocinitomicaceae bacterium]